PEKWRPMLAGAIGAAANAGFLLVGVIAKVWPVTSDSWRFMFLVGTTPALLVFFILLLVPESAKWKTAVTLRGSQPIYEIFSSQLRKPTILAILFGSVALIGTWGSVQWLPLWANKMAENQAIQKTRTEHPQWYGASPGSLSASELALKSAQEAASR